MSYIYYTYISITRLSIDKFDFYVNDMKMNSKYFSDKTENIYRENNLNTYLLLTPKRWPNGPKVKDSNPMLITVQFTNKYWR